MVPIKRTFEVDGVKVTLIRDGQGAHWTCEVCKARCAHVLKAAGWITLENFAEEQEAPMRIQ
jgi:hypothetical protein